MKRKLWSFRRRNTNFVWFTSKKKKREETKTWIFLFSKKEEKSRAILKTKDRRWFSTRTKEKKHIKTKTLIFFSFRDEKRRWEIQNSTKGRKEKRNNFERDLKRLKREENGLKSVILEKIEVVAVPSWIVRSCKPSTLVTCVSPKSRPGSIKWHREGFFKRGGLDA